MSAFFLERVKNIQDPVQKWAALIADEGFLKSDFSVQNLCFQEIYKDYSLNSENPPPAAWVPGKNELTHSNIAKFMKRLGLTSYSELHRWSVDNREAFWKEVLFQLEIKFATPYQKILSTKNSETDPEWLVGAKLNIAESCFLAPENQVAIVYQTETGEVRETTYKTLKQKSFKVASALKKFGIKSGDTVAIDMPMTEESVEIYLGVVLAGAAVVSIADSFAATEIATRLRISSAKLIFTQDYIFRSGKKLPLYSKVCDASQIPAIVVKKDLDSSDLRKQDFYYADFLKSNSECDAVECSPMNPINILFSSGTTGDPKAIVWNHTTPMKCASDGYFHHDIQASDRVAWPTNLGWMMGPWLLFATLLNRATLALYEGAPLGKEFGEFVAKNKVTILGLVPSIVKTWRSSKCMEGLDWSSIKLFSSTGECSNAEDYLYLMSLARFRPVIEYCGGTEIGGGFLTGTVVQSSSPSAFSTPAMGIDVEILDEKGSPVFGEGELYVVPHSIGLSTRLLNKNHDEVYFKDSIRNSAGILLRKHGDQMEKLPGGYFRALGRADDTMNLGGIKVSSAEIERSLSDISGVFETAAVAVNPPGGGPSLLRIFYVLKADSLVDEDALKKSFQQAISTKLNPLFKVHDIKRLDHLPRTASNKVMRRLLR